LALGSTEAVVSKAFAIQLQASTLSAVARFVSLDGGLLPGVRMRVVMHMRVHCGSSGKYTLRLLLAGKSVLVDVIAVELDRLCE